MFTFLLLRLWIWIFEKKCRLLSLLNFCRERHIHDPSTIRSIIFVHLDLHFALHFSSFLHPRIRVILQKHPFCLQFQSSFFILSLIWIIFVHFNWNDCYFVVSHFPMRTELLRRIWISRHELRNYYQTIAITVAFSQKFWCVLAKALTLSTNFLMKLYSSANVKTWSKMSSYNFWPKIVKTAWNKHFRAKLSVKWWKIEEIFVDLTRTIFYESADYFLYPDARVKWPGPELAKL